LLLELPDVAAQVLDAFRQTEMDREAQEIFSPLSTRELQVLEQVAIGRSNKEIALLLDISNQTVKNHVSSILRKLAVNDRMQAVFYALSRGWIKDIGTDDDAKFGAE
jgi:DNA-binding NarL/FixJ family response regulator